MTRRTRSAYDRWAGSYDSDPNPQTALEEADVLEVLSKLPPGRVLDAACGTGRYLIRLAEQRRSTAGCDFSLPMLRRARHRAPNASLFAADLADPLPLVSGAFSAVLCTQTLKHLPELEPTLREFHRVLGTRGMLTFTVTHPEMVWDGYEMREEPDFILSRESDIFHHASSVYRAALRATGFDLVEWRDIRVGESIRPYLTETSYEVVQGRPQVLLVSARKGATVAS